MLARHEMINKKNRRFNNSQRNFFSTSLMTIIIRNYSFFEFDFENSNESCWTAIVLRFVICLMQFEFLFLCFDFLHDQHLFCRENVSRFASFNLKLECNISSYQIFIHFSSLIEIDSNLTFEFWLVETIETIFDLTMFEMLKMIVVILLKLRSKAKENADFADFAEFCFVNFWFIFFLSCSIFRASCKKIFKLSKFLFNREIAILDFKMFLKIFILPFAKVLIRCQNLNIRW
jgi:hypothetical protein